MCHLNLSSPSSLFRLHETFQTSLGGWIVITSFPLQTIAGRGLESQLTHFSEHNNTTGDDLLIHSVETTFNSFLLKNIFLFTGRRDSSAQIHSIRCKRFEGQHKTERRFSLTFYNFKHKERIFHIKCLTSIRLSRFPLLGGKLYSQVFLCAFFFFFDLFVQSAAWNRS